MSEWISLNPEYSTTHHSTHTPPSTQDCVAVACDSSSHTIMQLGRQLQFQKLYGDDLGRYLYLRLKGVFIEM